MPRLPRTVLALLALTLLSCDDPASPPGGGDGRPIVFVGRVERPGESIGPPAIWSVRSDGSRLRRLGFGAGEALNPAWSRDGSRIAFATGAQGGPRIWIMNADGSIPMPASPNFPLCELWYTSISWDPSGTQMAADCSGDTWVMNLATQGSFSLSEQVDLDMHVPDWSADGQRLLFSGDVERDGTYDAVVVPPSGGTPVKLFGPAADPTWSPDGSMIAFTAGDAGRFELHVANADGSGKRRVTPLPAEAGADEGPSWSPDGRWLTFHRRASLCGNVGTPPQEVCIPHWSIYIVRSDGTGLRRVTPDSLQATRPSWW